MAGASSSGDCSSVVRRLLRNCRNLYGSLANVTALATKSAGDSAIKPSNPA